MSMKISPYLAGLLLGDGTLNKGKNRAYAVWIDQHQRNSKIIDNAVREFQSLGLNVHHYKFLNKVRAMIYSKEFFQKFESLRENPVSFFHKLSKIEKWKFISGFFDAEGTATDRLVIYNSRLEILKIFQK